MEELVRSAFLLTINFRIFTSVIIIFILSRNNLNKSVPFSLIALTILSVDWQK